MTTETTCNHYIIAEYLRIDAFQTFLCTACGVELKLTVADHNAALASPAALTGGFSAALDKTRGIGHEDCGHEDWGYYPPLQEIYILWCRTCGTIKQLIPSEDKMDIVGARFLNPLASPAGVDEWRERLTDQAVLYWCLTSENENDPMRMLRDIIQTAIRWENDPAISESAAKRKQEADKLRQLVKECVPWLEHSFLDTHSGPCTPETPCDMDCVNNAALGDLLGRVRHLTRLAAAPTEAGQC